MPVSSLDRKITLSRRTAKSWLQVEIIDTAGMWHDLKDIFSLIHNAASALVENPKIPKQPKRQVCIALSSDSEVQTLNWTYRGKKSPTNVLSFPAVPIDFSQMPQFMGDIIFARETIEREAKKNNVPFSAHVSHLTIHGLLHLLGYNHDTEREAQIMEDLEAEVLARLGISNPYKTT